ncbi:hypothetical protein HGRIS_013011 [Hohenbuehelia grisea]|uniref:Uncharacterized protein n=1 Tax=Hohenbuehelia grisea TaxID=104357 RepID=A0ABR3IUB2_9AGAR
MSAFSPSPAPRRSSRLRALPISPTRRPWAGPSSKPTSRLATPIGGHERASIVSGMDVDEAASVISERGAQRAPGETVYAKSDELLVTFYAQLPVEVKQILRNADFYRETYTGDIDTLTGFALVASIQTCFVWQHAQAVKGTPTCYIFSCPQDYNQISPPFHALLPYGATREPGLILVSPAGSVRFWDSIGIGLAGGENFSTIDLGLSEEESVTNLVRADPQTYIATTTFGHLFRLTLSSAAGKHNLSCHVFAKPQSSMYMSRLLPSFFGSPAAQVVSEPGNINAVALGANQPDVGQEVWALIDTRVQKWDMKAEGWEDNILDEDVASVIRTAVRGTFGATVEPDDAKMDLELLDIAIDSEGQLVILVSYAGKEDDGAMSVNLSSVRRIYALVSLESQGASFAVESVRSVPYQSTSMSGAPMHPRIRLLRGGPLVSIQFGDVVAICARDSDWRDRLELKSSTDRTLGVGVIDVEGTVLVLTAATMVKAYVDIEKVRAFDPETGRPTLIKSIMTQAILYGALSENPLHFSFPPEVEGESLMQGAQQLSRQVLESDHSLVRRLDDLTAQMAGRKDRLSWLIQFINENAVLVKMSQASRQTLATDAEKLYASYRLWLYYNEHLSKSPKHSVLHDAVHEYMTGINQAYHEDVMRAFFRLHVANIGKLVKKVDVVVQEAPPVGMEPIDLLPDANQVVLTILKSALEYRELNAQVYGLDPPMINPWTSKASVVDVVLGLFEATTKVVDTPNPSSHSRKTSECSAQLPELAAVLFACVQERLNWLGSHLAPSDSGAEHHELEQRFALLRPEVLETLRRTGHAEAAFTLAEKYQDLSSLAALCHREAVYPPQQNPHAERIQAYIDKFRDSFTTELYRWYIQHGELRTMFAQEDAHAIYMDRFFAQHRTPWISWLHDLGKERYGAAATTLIDEAQKASNLETQQLMLSIGKLAHLAQLQENEGAVNPRMLDAFHDDLDFVSVHQALVEEFRTALPTRGRLSLDAQVELILKQKAKRIADMPALSHIFKQLAKELLQGKVVSHEDAVDTLTLQDNTTTIENYMTALHLLARAETLPETRRDALFRAVWRRIYTHDDWDEILKTANVTDTQLNERFRNTALFATLCALGSRDLESDDSHSSLELTPDSAAVAPTQAEIASRWPGMSNEEAENLERDYVAECLKVGAMDLGDVYVRVKELVQQELAVGDGW